MPKPTTLVEAILEPQVDSTLTVVRGPGEDSPLRFSELRGRALALLHRLQSEHGLSAGDPLVLHADDVERFAEGFWACVIGGLVPVPIAVGSSDEHRRKLERVLDTVGGASIYGESAIRDRLAMTDRWISADQAPAIGLEGTPHRASADDLAFVQFSSGSTNAPKGVQLTHGNVLCNIWQIHGGAGLRPEDAGLSWMPLTHDMGLIGFHIAPLVTGLDHGIIPTALFVRRPMLWLETATRLRSSVLSSPNFGYKHALEALAKKGPGELDLSAVRLIFNGAEPISLELCERFLDTFEPFGLRRSAMFPVYGLAEASVAVSFSPPEGGISGVQVARGALGLGDQVEVCAADRDDAVPLVSVGRNVEGCEVRLTDADGDTVAPGTVGNIEIRGGNVTKGFYQAPERFAEVDRGDGWVDTGDLGFVHRGDLVIAGRAKEIVFVHGLNVFPADLEQVAQNSCDLELGKVAVTGWRPAHADEDELLVFVQYRGSNEDFAVLAGKLRASLAAQAGCEVSHVLPVRRIPKTTSGKIQRHALLASYEAGEFAESIAALEALRARSRDEDAATTSDSPISEQLATIAARVLPERQISPADNLFEIGISSLELAQLHVAIDEAFPNLVDITDLFEHPSMETLATLLAERGTQSPKAD